MGKRHVSLGFDIWWPDRPRVWQFVKRHLLPTTSNVLFTLLVVTGLIWASSVGALPLGAALTSSTSTSTIAYQGRLADAGGNPLTDTYNMIFRLYAAALGGVPLWEEQWTGSNGVQVSDGLFNVMLGSLTPIPQSVITGNDSLFLGITVGTDDEMEPRVQLGSVPFAVQALTVPDGSITEDKLAPGLSLIPPGTIVMWSGSLAEIPDGWVLCDGTNGTPDLTDRFILSVSASEDPGETGGSHTKTLSVSNLPSHTHSFTTDSAGSHTHRLAMTGGQYGGHNCISKGWCAVNWDDDQVEGAGSHTHSGTTDATGSGSSLDIRPKYYKLAFIMKLS